MHVNTTCGSDDRNDCREYTAGMSRPHPPLRILLHILLSLALLANGIGAAMASAHAGCIHSATVAALSVVESSVETQATAEPPCHGDMPPEAISPLADIAHQGVPADASSTDADGAGDDCDNACDCACTAHVQAALMPPTLLLRDSVRIAHAQGSTYTHAAPALPHPVRPPIG